MTPEKIEALLQRVANGELSATDAMEELTRLNVNQALLRKNLIKNEEAGNAPLEAELIALRVGDIRLLAFPGGNTVELGLEINKVSPQPFSFISGYTNGYLYYLPTEAQRKNPGYAQEDCDFLVAPEWHGIFHARALEVLKGL